MGLELAKEGRFREDLFYRLRVFGISVPPLADRLEDVPSLIDHFITAFNGRTGREIKGLTSETLKLLLSYHYPGNVRELEAVVEHMCIVSDGETIRPSDLPPFILDAAVARELGVHRTTVWRMARRYGLI